MPEAHALHRHARDQREALAGQVLSVTSPQGKFDAAPFDGHRLTDVQAYGTQARAMRRRGSTRR